MQKRVILGINEQHCQACADAVREGPIDLDDSWNVGYAPPFHPRCGCDLVPVINASDKEGPRAEDPFDLMEKANKWHDARNGRFDTAPGGQGAAPMNKFKQHRLEMRQFINQKLHIKHETESHIIGPVMQVSRIRKNTGHDVTGYSTIAENTALGHSLRHHGDHSSEAKRGQIAVTKDDFQHIPEIIQTGEPSKADTTRSGTQGVKFSKTIEGISYHVLSDVRPTTKRLAFKSMHKKRG